MMEFLAANFNLPTIIVGAIVFGGVGWITCTLISMAAAVDAAAAVTALQWKLQQLRRWLPLSNRVGEGGAGQGFGPRPFCKPRVRVI